MRRGDILKVLCLTMILLITGCSNQKEQEIYYKTIDIGMKTGITGFSSSVLMEDNKILLDTYMGEERVFVLIDGKFNVEDIIPITSNVEENEIHEACEGSKHGHTYHNRIAYKSNQEIVNLTVNYIDNHDTVDLYVEIYNFKNSKMSESKKINLPLKGREMYLDFKVDSKGNYYLVQADGKVEVRDPDLNIKQQFFDGFYTEVIKIDQDTMGLIKVGEGRETVIEHIDNNTFEIKESYEAPEILQGITYHEGSLQGMLGNRLMTYNRTTQEIKELIDLTDYFDVNHMISTNQLEDNYYFSVFRNQEESLELRGFIPTIKEESEILNRGKISLGTRNKEWGDQIGKEIKSKHPGIKVDITAHDGIGLAEWNNIVNTELLSGNGEDMYIDISSWQHIVDNQLAYDMKAFIEELVKENPDDYQRNLLEAITTEEGISVLPGSIHLPVVVMDKEIASAYNLYEIQENWTWDEFIDVLRVIQSELDKDRALLGNFESLEIMRAYFIGENLTLRNKEIAKQKDKIQEILSIGLELRSFEGEEKIGYGLGGGIERPEAAKQVMNNTVVAIKYARDYDIFTEVNDNYAILKLPKNNRGWFVGSGIIVNNQSKDLDLMMKVVTDLYIQGDDRSEHAGFRLYNKYMKEQKTNHEKGSIYDAEWDITTPCRKVDPRSLDTMEEIYNSANKWIGTSEYTWNQPEIEKCLNKEITPEVAADLIINKAVLYQKE